MPACRGYHGRGRPCLWHWLCLAFGDAMTAATDGAGSGLEVIRSWPLKGSGGDPDAGSLPGSEVMWSQPRQPSAPDAVLIVDHGRLCPSTRMCAYSSRGVMPRSSRNRSWRLRSRSIAARPTVHMSDLRRRPPVASVLHASASASNSFCSSGVCSSNAPWSNVSQLNWHTFVLTPRDVTYDIPFSSVLSVPAVHIAPTCLVFFTVPKHLYEYYPRCIL